MENPLNLPIPTNPIGKVHALTKDIAYISIHQAATSHFRVKQVHDQGVFSDGGLNKYLEPKWGDNHNYYLLHLLVSYGYLVKSSVELQEDGVTFYDVTLKAFNLLEEPSITPKVFISYKREYSSALALLVEAKLKLRDSGIGIFIDKVIKPGDDWEENISEKIRESPYFICLLSPNTYAESKWVRDELEWAYDAGCKIISVFHAGAELNDRYPVWLGKKQIIKVDFETAKHYESALDEILVGLGYSTY